MTFSIVEDIRATHQELDRLTNILTKLLLPSQPKSHRDRLIQSHRANYLSKLISQRSLELLEFYLDSDGQLSNESQRISSSNNSQRDDQNQQQGPENGNTNVSNLKEFYKRLDQLQQFHIKYPQLKQQQPQQHIPLQQLPPPSSSSNHPNSQKLNQIPQPTVQQQQSVIQAAPQLFQQDIGANAGFDWSGLEGQVIDGRDFIDRMFTGEEMLGRFLDLHLYHDQYNNLTSSSSSSSSAAVSSNNQNNNQSNNPSFKRLPYISYIDSFDNFESIPKSTKFKADYQKYLQGLSDYLKSFINRTEPLYDLDSELLKFREDFDLNWSKGQIKSWQKQTNKTNEDENEEGINNNEESNIWCEACLKSYSKKTVYDAHLTSKKHQKNLNNKQNSQAVEKSQKGTAKVNMNDKKEKEKHLAYLEEELKLYSNHLSSIKVDTKSNVERRSALTDKERQQELIEFEIKQRLESSKNQSGLDKINNGGGANNNGEGEGEEEDDDDENRVYNPLKLPLGWDGKPIPYWLYKLHGLGVEYKCEICSDFIYMGRKNFERHFQESRHSFGMRALGLPNTKHFHEITKIEDAFALAEKLKSEGRAEIFRDETMEELEDDEGNVYNRKTYEDLKRQGLL